MPQIILRANSYVIDNGPSIPFPNLITSCWIDSDSPNLPHSFEQRNFWGAPTLNHPRNALMIVALPAALAGATIVSARIVHHWNALGEEFVTAPSGSSLSWLRRVTRQDVNEGATWNSANSALNPWITPGGDTTNTNGNGGAFYTLAGGAPIVGVDSLVAGGGGEGGFPTEGGEAGQPGFDGRVRFKFTF